MPKIRGYTPEQKRAQEAERKKQEAKRVKQFIHEKSRESRFRGISGLAEEINVKPSTLHSALRNGSIRACTMRDIIRALDMTNDDVLRLMGR